MAEKKKKKAAKKKPLGIREFVKNLLKPIENKGGTNVNTVKLMNKVDKS